LRTSPRLGAPVHGGGYARQRVHRIGWLQAGHHWGTAGSMLEVRRIILRAQSAAGAHT